MKIEDIEFKDSRIRNVFLEMYHETDSVYIQRGLRKVIPFVFSNCLLDDIDADFIMNGYSNASEFQTYKPARYVLFMVIRLYEKRLVDNESARRLFVMKDRIYRQAISCSELNHILYWSRFDDFMEGYDLTRRDTSPIFFFTMDDIDFVDQEFRAVCDGYAESIIFRKPGHNSPTWRSLFGFKAALACGLSGYELDELQRITCPELSAIIDNIQKKHYKAETFIESELFNFILYLKDNELHYKNNAFCRFCYIIENMKLYHSRAIEILRSEYIDRYIVVKGTKDKRLIYVNIESEELRQSYIQFLMDVTPDSTHATYEVPAHFEASFGEIRHAKISDLSFETYQQQINFFKDQENYELKKRNFNAERHEYAQVITSYYFYIYTHYGIDPFASSGLSANILMGAGLKYTRLGYSIVAFNPLSDMPSSDKWAIYYEGADKVNIAVKVSFLKAVVFDDIKDNVFREWAKHFIWYGDNSLTVRVNKLHGIKRFLNYIADLKSGEELSIYVSPNKSHTIKIEEMLAYRTYCLNSLSNNTTINHWLDYGRAILNHVIKHELGNVEQGALMHMRSINKSEVNPLAIDRDELKTLIKTVDSKRSRSTIDAMSALVFHILLETEFRISQVLALKIDCVRETLKKNEYCILSRTKTGNEEDLQPIKLVTKRQIDELILLTDEYRKNTPSPKQRNYIFLIPGKKPNSYSFYTRSKFNDFLKECCNEAKTSKVYTSGNLRDTYMTSARNYSAKKGLSKLESTVLTGHRNPDSDIPYFDIDMKTAIEAANKVIIGNLELKGKIISKVSDSINNDEHLACNECGYCQSKSCTNFSYVSCLMCGDFITDPTRIEFFQKYIDMVSKLILKTDVPHDKEDLVNIKRLLTAYLYELKRISETE